MITIDPDIEAEDVVTPLWWCAVCGVHRAGEADGQYGTLCPGCDDAVGIEHAFKPDTVACSNDRGEVIIDEWHEVFVAPPDRRDLIVEQVTRYRGHIREVIER